MIRERLSTASVVVSWMERTCADAIYKMITDRVEDTVDHCVFG